MKRLHVHVGVKNLAEAVRFYSAVFGAQPVKVKPDYAKWLLAGPSLNFAISTRSGTEGVNHLGIQVDDDSELTEIRTRLREAELGTFDEGETTCCYARSDKTWIVDPAGIRWEAYRNMADAEIYTPPVVKSGAKERPACCMNIPAG
ncbi:MAG: VOC family protein [Gammaproteobacteria bacterium]|nr:VOC family protein [Gammaproteobacteria bacterium]